jgi:hypothetical protein
LFNPNPTRTKELQPSALLGKTIAVRVVWTAGFVEWKLEGLFGLLHSGKFKSDFGESGEKRKEKNFPAQLPTPNFRTNRTA